MHVGRGKRPHRVRQILRLEVAQPTAHRYLSHCSEQRLRAHPRHRKRPHRVRQILRLEAVQPATHHRLRHRSEQRLRTHPR
eukprot:857698-Prymnesium_polylepis.1